MTPKKSVKTEQIKCGTAKGSFLKHLIYITNEFIKCVINIINKIPMKL